ncbi:TetR/AcrR family transcriptional regulator [Clostridium folliculivorans]|uniref:AcrR family transcriptional regulator n=1 Tax=Clostridium folliculivorans TaxID=2886038 RepID=A0A9W5Y5Z7_9CLOT|nr:TetR/AcrR family transcriptional regulator [Clostridium folliculivorans]GKU27366.1 AcrR family transcriptional regulator [Clostridium folliculivorans]GKU32217.1 AcrR family transcriptional regulator [Clostridium folliculivorans]
MVRENKEQIILEAAIKIFSEKGFSAATTSEIAKSAGVAEGTIFRYFKTKKDLLTGAMVKLVEVFSEMFIVSRINKIFKDHEGMDPKITLKAIAKDRLDLIDKHWDLIKVVITELQFHDDLRNSFLENMASKGKLLLENFIKSGISRGIFRDINPTIAARALVGTLGIYIVQRQLVPSMVNMNDDEQIDIIIDLFLNGLNRK